MVQRTWTLVYDGSDLKKFGLLGREIIQKQEELGWSARVIEQLSDDLRRAFPDMKGFSRTNLLYMRKFAESYPDESIVQQLVGQIPWGHNVRLWGKAGTRFCTEVS